MTEIDTTRFEADPETGLVATTFEEMMRWHDWLDEHMPEFEQKHPGKYLAIWDDEIVGISDDGWEAGEQARKRYPKPRRPVHRPRAFLSYCWFFSRLGHRSQHPWSCHVFDRVLFCFNDAERVLLARWLE